MITIGTAYTCFKEKFGIPRQPGLVPSSKGYIQLNYPYCQPEALKGLETFSHIILTFIPHQSSQKSSLSVRPPRLGGNEKLGVFATRSPFRPNPICSSVVKMDLLDIDKGQILFSNHDLLDKSPILDIKPYIPEWDIIPTASNGWIDDHPEHKDITISFNDNLEIPDELRSLTIEVLLLNPKPRYQQKTNYAFRLEDYDIHFEYITDSKILVYKVNKI